MAFVLLFVGVILWNVEGPVGLDDGLRHYAMGSRIMTDGIGAADWGTFVAYGPLANTSVDPWFGTDVIFALLSPLGPVASVKVFAVVSLVALLCSLLWALRAAGTPQWAQALLIVMLVLFRTDLLLRILLGRPLMLMSAIVIATVTGILSRKTWVHLPLLMIAVLLSQLWVFPAAIWITGMLWYLMIGESFAAKRLLFFGLGGIALGLLLHPHPLAYLQYMMDGFAAIPLAAGSIRLPGEMEPGWPTALSMIIALACIAALQIWHVRTIRRLSSSLVFLDILTLLFFALFLKHLRAVDIAWPLIIITSGTTIGLVMIDRKLERVVAVLMSTGMIFCIANASLAVREFMMHPRHDLLQQYRATAKAIPEKARILNPDWDDFAPLVALRPDVNFAAGIDPTFLAMGNPEGYALTSSLFEPGASVSVSKWLPAIRKAFLGENILVLNRSRHTLMINGLMEFASLKDLAKGGGAMAVFDLK